MNKSTCGAIPAAHLEQRGQEHGKRVDICLCAIFWGGIVDRSEDPLEEERAGVCESDADECQEEIPNHVPRIGGPEFPNDAGMTEVFEQQSERAGGKCRTQLPNVVLV